MKKKTYLILLFICISASSFSQVLIGPTAGLNYSWIAFGDKDNRRAYIVKPVLGFNAGLQVSFKVRKRFFLNTSLIYSTKGKLIESKSDGTLRNRARYNFIELPITYSVDFKNTFGRDKVFKWFMGIGPNISYWLGGKGNLFNSDLAEQTHRSQSYKVTFKEGDLSDETKMNVPNPNRLQLGLNVSAGVAFEPGGSSRKILFTVRYEIGHSYFSKSDKVSFPNTITYQDDLRFSNRGLRVSLAYLFDLRTDQRKRGKSTIKKRKNL